MRRRTLRIAGVVALAASLLGPTVQAAITGDAGRSSHMSGFGHMGSWGNAETTGDVIEGASEQEVTATEFAFSPDELTMTVGEPINLSVNNVGGLPHDLVILDLGVRLAVGPAGQTTTGVEVGEAGSYQFVCSYPGHVDAGTTGLLTVKPKT